MVADINIWIIIDKYLIRISHSCKNCNLSCPLLAFTAILHNKCLNSQMRFVGRGMPEEGAVLKISKNNSIFESFLL